MDEPGKGSVLARSDQLSLCASAPLASSEHLRGVQAARRKQSRGPIFPGLLSFRRSLEDTPDPVPKDSPGQAGGHCNFMAWTGTVVPEFSRMYLRSSAKAGVQRLAALPSAEPSLGPYIKGLSQL